MRKPVIRAALVSAAVMWGVTFTLAAAARGQDAAPAAPTTVWDKVYTAEQAKRGEALYQENCSECHSEDMGGNGYAPPLKGDDFTVQWSGKTVGDVFERIRKLMPPDEPGSLPLETYRDIVSFILQSNTYPAGDRELGSDLATLRQIQITSKNP
jgi:polar amino acid transport system substrate-binding protein